MHPYAFFEPVSLLKGQKYLSTIFLNDDLGYFESLFKWIHVYKETLYLSIPLGLNILNLLILIFYKFKYKFYFFFNLVLFLTSVLTILCVPIGNQQVFDDNYLVGLLPISFLQIILFIKIISYQINIIKNIVLTIFVLLSLIALFVNYNILFENLLKRLNYKNTVQFKLFEYSKKNFTLNDKITVDHNSGSLPEHLNSNMCHYWKNCSTYGQIVKLKPNYVIFSDPLPEFTWSDNIQGKNLKRYVEENNMVLLKIFKEENNKNLKLLLYKSQ